MSEIENLLLAIQEDDEDRAIELAKSASNINQYFEQIGSVLLMAVACNKERLVENLIKNGADVELIHGCTLGFADPL